MIQSVPKTLTALVDPLTNEEWRNEISRVDIPERLYIRLKDRLNPKESELEMEARWIYNAKKHWKKNQVGEDRMIESITNVLTHFRKNYFDIPFISTYRCYLFQQELEPSDFYEIYEMDLEWDNFLKTQRAVYEKISEVKDKLEDFQTIEDAINLATSNTDLHDILEYVEFYKNLLPENQSKIVRIRDKKKKTYAKIIECKIDQFVKEIALRPSEFARNLRVNSLLSKPKRMPTNPSTLASTYKHPKMPEVLDVLINT